MAKSDFAPMTDGPFSGEKKGRLEDQYHVAWQAYKKTPTPEARTALVSQLTPVIDNGLKAFGADGSATLRTQAKLLAAKALDTYDPAKGKLGTHVMSSLQGLSRLRQREQQIIHVPERHAAMQRHVMDSEERLRDELGREPSDAEIADASNVSLKMLGKLRTAAPVNTGSLLDAAGNQREASSVLPVNAERKYSWTDFVYEDQDNINKIIMENLLGMRGRPVLPIKAIAAKLNLTPSAVSQRAAKIQAELSNKPHMFL